MTATDFAEALARLPAADAPALPRAILMIRPEGFVVDPQSAVDNPYMEPDADTEPPLAQHQFEALALAVEATGMPVMRYPGSPDTPDEVFCNNAFATAVVDGERRFIVGHMHHSHRRRETRREDLPRHFSSSGYRVWDLSQRPLTAELTGALVIDRARRIGFCGMSRRVDEAGLAAMHEAFGLRLTLRFDLAPEEYHTNVVMSVLAGRAAVVCPDGLADAAVVTAIEAAFPDAVVTLDRAEKEAFCGNCLAVTDADLMLSETAAEALRPHNRDRLEALGFRLHAVDVSELEKAGGSVRCMLAEVF